MVANSSDSSSPMIAHPNSSPQGATPPLSFTQASINSITIQNIGSMVQTKLKRHNYLIWKSLFDPIFHHYKLVEIVDGSEPAPPQILTDS
ncbi:hypothetical protein FF2_015288 [Malus domestica]